MFLLFLCLFSLIILLLPFLFLSSYTFIASFSFTYLFSSPHPPLLFPFPIFPVLHFLQSFFSLTSSPCPLRILLHLRLLILLFVSTLTSYSSKFSFSPVLSLPFCPFSFYVFILTFTRNLKKERARLINPISTDVCGWLLAYIDMMRTEPLEGLHITSLWKRSIVLAPTLGALPRVYCADDAITNFLLQGGRIHSATHCYVEGSLMLAMMYL